MEPDEPSRSTSCSCAKLNKSSPSFPSIVLISFPLASRNVTLILIHQLSSYHQLIRAYPVPGAGLTRSPCLITSISLPQRRPCGKTRDKGLRGVDEKARFESIDPDFEDEGTDRNAREATTFRAWVIASATGLSNLVDRCIFPLLLVDCCSSVWYR